eukprot:COSAG03_NODE_1016_length_5016_cov_18.038641_2_plen_194_part_00
MSQRAIWLRSGKRVSNQIRRLLSAGHMRCLRCLPVAEDEEDEEEEEAERTSSPGRQQVKSEPIALLARAISGDWPKGWVTNVNAPRQPGVPKEAREEWPQHWAPPRRGVPLRGRRDRAGRSRAWVQNRHHEVRSSTPVLLVHRYQIVWLWLPTALTPAADGRHRVTKGGRGGGAICGARSRVHASAPSRTSPA